MDWPPVNRGPLHGRVACLADMAIDGIEAGASGGARVLRILGEGHCMLHPITAGGRSCGRSQVRGGRSYRRIR